jgi:hypothetical protein
MAWGAQIRGIDNLSPEMEAAVHEGAQAGLEVLGAKGTEIVVKNISTPYNDKPAAVCSGNLAASVVSIYAHEATQMKVIIGVSPSLHADVYAAPVETGAKPHMPPPGDLLAWVQKKFGIDNEKDALSAAWAVATVIRKRGTQGHQMFSRALTDLEPLAVPALEHEIALALERHGFAGGVK